MTSFSTCRIFRQRLAAQEKTEGAGADPADPALSFFSMVSCLQRAEAVKLFYQTLVTHTTGFIKAEQPEAYGDITIRPGRFL